MKRTLLGIVAITLALAPIGGVVLATSDLADPPDLVIVGEGGVLDKITNWLFGIFLGVATIYIIIAGFFFVTAQGNPEKLTKAKRAILYAVIGIGIAIISASLKNFIKMIIESAERTT